MNAAKRDDKLDEAIEETFPASDPPANTVEVGVHVQPVPQPDDIVVVDNTTASQFEAFVDGQLAFLQYERRPDGFVLIHTEVPEALRGRGVAGRLAAYGLHIAETSGLPVIVQCPFVRSYLQRRHGAPGRGPEAAR
jgi:predicted GNAT family acetyltransferase